MKIINFWFKGKWVTPILVSLFLLIGALWFWFYREDDQKLLGIISGLITGFIVLVFQVWLSWVELKKMEKWDALKIIDILPTRDDPNYYRPLIQKAKEEIKIQGVTCKRFLDDFANGEKNAPDRNKVLLDALKNNNELKVRILVAAHSYLDEEDKSKSIAAKLQMEELSKNFPGRFFYSFYEHEPKHSIMVIDRESFVGPAFPHVSSKFSPAMHLKNDSAFGKHYLKYFRDEWKEWSKNKEDLQD